MEKGNSCNQGTLSGTPRRTRICPKLAAGAFAALSWICFWQVIAQPSAAPDHADKPLALRLFRVRALLTVLTYQPKAEDAALDDKSRRELTEMFDRQIERVEEAAAELSPKATAPPYDELMQRAENLASEFDQHIFQSWLHDHPDAAAAIEKQSRIDENVYSTLIWGDRDKLVQLAIDAGLDTTDAAAARKLVEEQYGKLKALNETAQRKQQDEFSRLPADQQQMALDLLMVEGQLEIVRAGREVRRGLMKMLTPEQQRVLDAKFEQLEAPNR